MKRKVEFVTGLSLKDLKAEIDAFFEKHDDHRWSIVSINDGGNRSYTAWLEHDPSNDGT